MRQLKIEWIDFVSAAEQISSAEQHLSGESRGYLDRETGAVFVVDQETADSLQSLLEDAGPNTPVETIIAEADVPEGERKSLLDAWRAEEPHDERLIDLADLDLRDEHRDLVEFTATVQDAAVRRQLEQAIDGPSAFRRFRNIVHGTFRERVQWFAFQKARRIERATAWLASLGIEVEWGFPKAPDLPPRPSPREHLLVGVLTFVETVRQAPGVNRIALLGSLTRDESEPKDADVLVTISDSVDLNPLAKAGRRLAGHAQQLNRGADVFLADARGEYLGRTCPWRNCAPGIRRSCRALHCGRRTYLYDDLQIVNLAPTTIAEPPVDLWPHVHVRIPVPEDVERLVLAPLRNSRT